IIAQYDSTSYAPSTLYSSSPFSFAPSEYVYLARIPNVITNAFLIVIAFLIAWFFISYWVGLVASVWLLLNGDMMIVNTAVGLDSFAAFFTTASVLFIVLSWQAIYKNKKWWKVLTLSALTGLCIAFAISSKLNSGVLVFIVMLIYALAGA